MLGQRLGLRGEVVDEAVVVCRGRGARDVEGSSRKVAQFWKRVNASPSLTLKAPTLCEVLAGVVYPHEQPGS